MPGFGRNWLRNLMMKQAKPSPNVGKHMGGHIAPKAGGMTVETKSLLREISEDVANGDTDALHWPNVPPVKSESKIKWKNVDPDIQDMVDDSLGKTPAKTNWHETDWVPADVQAKTKPMSLEEARARFKDADKRAKEEGFTVNAHVGTGKVFDPTRQRIDGSHVRWYTGDTRMDKLAAESYATKFGSSNWAMDPATVTPIENGANIAPVKLKLGRNLVVDADHARWTQIKASNIGDAKIRTAMQALYGKTGRFSTDTIVEKARKSGRFDSVTFKNIKDFSETDTDTPSHTVHALWRPENVRGRFAEFSNKNRGKLIDLLGGGALAAGVGAILSAKQKETT